MAGNGSGKPFGPANLQSQIDWFDKCLLGLIVCLPASAAEPTVAGAPVGILQVGPGHAKTAARRTDVGLALARGHQGHGLGPEMLKYAVGWCFDSLGLNKVELGTFGFNVAAQACYDKVGFVREGVKRESDWVQGRWVDSWEYGMLRREWEVLKSKWDEEEQERLPMSRQHLDGGGGRVRGESE